MKDVAAGGGTGAPQAQRAQCTRRESRIHMKWVGFDCTPMLLQHVVPTGTHLGLRWGVAWPTKGRFIPPERPSHPPSIRATKNPIHITPHYVFLVVLLA